MPLRAQASTTLVIFSILRSSRPFAPTGPTPLRRKLSHVIDGLYGPTNGRPLNTPSASGCLAATPGSGRAEPRCGKALESFGGTGGVNGLHSSATRLLAVPVVPSSGVVDNESTSGSLDTLHQRDTLLSTSQGQIPPGLFSDLDLHRSTHAAISDVMGYTSMTKVQEQSIPVCLTGVDVLAKAKTGTGKTLAFLIPAIERAVEATTAAARAKDGVQAKRFGKGDISAIVISPTRELAQQIAAEAQQVMSFHRLKLMCSVGGTNINRDLNQLASGAPDILVATPGRLVDLLENHGMARLTKTLCMLVFDEADQLLEMGFRPTIETILRRLPSKADRQTVLFSATMPGDVQAIASIALRPEFEMVDCVGEEEDTHQHVSQKYAVVPSSELMPRLLATLLEARKDPDHKIIVFFVAARVVQAYAELFNSMGLDVLETHSRKSQSARTRVSEAFRNGRGVVMFTSDVSARGMDYPDVSLVVQPSGAARHAAMASALQVGLPADQNQYVHRLGRTARAGKGGRGLVLLTEDEQGFLREVKHLSLEEDERVPPGMMAEARQRVAEGKVRVAEETIAMAYAAWLGFYKGNLKRMRWTPETLVQEANSWATRFWGLPSPPGLAASTVGKMGLRGVRGLVVDDAPRTSRNQAGGSRGRNQGGGRDARDVGFSRGDAKGAASSNKMPRVKRPLVGGVDGSDGWRSGGNARTFPGRGRGTHGGGRKGVYSGGRGDRR